MDGLQTILKQLLLNFGNKEIYSKVCKFINIANVSNLNYSIKVNNIKTGNPYQVSL